MRAPVKVTIPIPTAGGLLKFDKTLAAIKLVERRDDAADGRAVPGEASAEDSAGKELDGVIQTIKTFAYSIAAGTRDWIAVRPQDVRIRRLDYDFPDR